MYGNRGGRPELDDVADGRVSTDDARSLLSTTDAVADEVRTHLSEAFSVESTVVATPYGPQGAVSIYVPEAEPIGAAITLDELDGLTPVERRELVRDLVATAVGHARDTFGDRIVDAAQ